MEKAIIITCAAIAIAWFPPMSQAAADCGNLDILHGEFNGHRYKNYGDIYVRGNEANAARWRADYDREQAKEVACHKAFWDSQTKFWDDYNKLR